MKALIVHMGGLKEGRKALIVVSEGYSNTLPPQLRDQIASVPGFGNPNRGNPTAGENNPNEDRYRFFAGQDLEFYMQGVYEVASQNNVAIYTVDPRGLPAFEFDINEGVGTTVDSSYLRSAQETLRALALETDGRAILNRNDLDVGMKQIMRDSSAYYLLGYTSPATTWPPTATSMRATTPADSLRHSQPPAAPPQPHPERALGTRATRPTQRPSATPAPAARCWRCRVPTSSPPAPTRT